MCSSKPHNYRHTDHLKYLSFYKILCFYLSWYYSTSTWFYFHTLTSLLRDLHHGRYNPDTDSWSTDVAPLSCPRSGVCLVVMDGYLYAIGGHDGIAAINTVERYCSMSGTKTVNPLNAYWKQIRLFRACIYIFFNIILLFSPFLREWSTFWLLFHSQHHLAQQKKL